MLNITEIKRRIILIFIKNLHWYCIGINNSNIIGRIGFDLFRTEKIAWNIMDKIRFNSYIVTYFRTSSATNHILLCQTRASYFVLLSLSFIFKFTCMMLLIVKVLQNDLLEHFALSNAWIWDLVHLWKASINFCISTDRFVGRPRFVLGKKCMWWRVASIMY